MDYSGLDLRSLTDRTFITSPLARAEYVAMSSSVFFNYITKLKIGGSFASISFVKQIPLLTLDQIPDWLESHIIERVAELCYINHDLDDWMYELWHDEEMMDDTRFAMLDRLEECNDLYFDDDIYPMPEFSNMQPYIYNEQRRAIAQAELDAIFAHLYGLTTEELHYILDPEDVCGKDCINETFRVLRDNEMRQYDEYRTKRLVLEAWNKFVFDN